MMGMILNDWDDDGCGCLGCRAGGVFLAPLLLAPSPPAPLPLLSGVLGERGVVHSWRRCRLGIREGSLVEGRLACKR